MKNYSDDNPLINIAKNCMIDRNEQRDVRLKDPTFVQQLVIIDKNEEDLLEAIKDKFQAEKCRQGWLDKGYVRKEDLENYEDQLTRIHKLEFERPGHDKLGGDEERVAFGQDTYKACHIESLRLVLNRWVPQGHYNAGNLHELADKCKIGWHPDWKRLLAPKKDEK